MSLLSADLEGASMAEDARSVVLRASDVCVRIPTRAGTVTPVDHVSLELRRGEVLGIVGETGSGKTVTCRSLLGLMPSARATHTGSVTYPGVLEGNALDLGPKRMRRYWGDFVSMVPQNPMTSLNPVHRIGAQLDEAVAAHSTMSRSERRKRVIELMTRVGIPVPEKRLRDYPHQFSGGMLQRTLIAIALAANPRVLVADEPTTALDVIIQDQILSLLIGLQRDLGMSLVLVSHDLSVIAQICDRVGVMYAGQLVELADTRELLRRPKHPYTAALLKSLPGAVARDAPLATITGAPPRLMNLTPACRFVPRCPYAEPACGEWHTELLQIGTTAAGHQARCRRHGELDLALPAVPEAAARTPGQPIEPMHAADNAAQ
ncbi:ABC transporter ATP-binding protein [Jatrophihabitans lederbergiae]|uniref:ABC transporter ATP-binding protein n=1 Tax=Jatrophihabitans lederbergiae TaxID=3075547 RepID=A0ABU2JEP3_9ACTN|nr:ABC transporter ATP-binding protein [Jatrophihabitans sp. DSM 44399]MDT0263470.1 ABC transporter ATP-binding protein [Jatrophihabitans sp. DSM 44399]